jgi:drug/metabolite transporter (DMT)-like permease
MGSTAGESVTPGHASTRPGVWLTDLSLILMALIWGVNFSVVKYGTSLVEPLAYNGFRVALAASLLAAIVALGRLELPARRDILALLGLGVLGNAIYQFFFVMGISRTRASDAALVIAATPAFIAIIGRIRGTERTSGRGIIGILLSIVGIGLVVMGTANDVGGQASLIGDALVLCGSLAWAIYTVWLKPYTTRIGGLQLSAITMMGGAIPLLLVAAPSMRRADWAHLPLIGWAAIAYSGIGALVVAYYFWYRGVRILGPTRTAMYSNLQPVIAVLVAWGMLGEKPTVWQIVGAACIMGGLALTRI